MKFFPCSLDELDDAPVFLQTGFWGRFKEHHGWKALGFRVSWPSEANAFSPQTFPVLVLLRQLNKNITLAYIPHGPVGKDFFPLPSAIGSQLESRLVEFAQDLRPYLTKSVFALRFDLLSGTIFQQDLQQQSGETFPDRLRPPLRKPSDDVQPTSTVVLDLSLPLEILLERMKKKTRYNIRLAEKKGVSVSLGTSKELSLWYKLYKETAHRDKMAIHRYEYYKTLFEMTQTETSPVKIHLLLAYHGNILLAGNLVLIYREQGVYLYGASSNQDRHLMAPYALQFKAISLCQQSGCKTYDLFGIPPNDNPRHPMHGLYRFKTGFGGQILHRQGTWDFCYKPLEYHFIHFASRLRTWYYKKWKKRRRFFAQ